MPAECGHSLLNVDVVSSRLGVFLEGFQTIPTTVDVVDASVIFVLREWRKAYSPDAETSSVDRAGQPFEPLSCGFSKYASLIIRIHQRLNQVSFQIVSLDRKAIRR